MGGVEVTMLDRGLAEQATALIASLRIPVTYTNEQDGASQWQLNGTQRIQVAFGAVDYMRDNIIRPGDGSHPENLMLPHLTDETSYAITMHELGHSIGRTTAEREAWAWAYEHSPVWTVAMLQSARWSLYTYVTGGHFTASEVEEFLKTMPVKGVAQ